MLIMIEKDIKGEICHVIYQHATANNYMKVYDKKQRILAS